MKSDKKWLRTASQCCAEIGPEDGIAPRLLAKQQKVSKREHKQLQLCKRVNRTMNLLFLDESLDPALRDLVVDRVELSSNGRQFVITILVDYQRHEKPDHRRVSQCTRLYSNHRRADD